MLIQMLDVKGKTIEYINSIAITFHPICIPNTEDKEYNDDNFSSEIIRDVFLSSEKYFFHPRCISFDNFSSEIIRDVFLSSEMYNFSSEMYSKFRG